MVARVSFADGSQTPIVLRGGSFRGTLPSQPRWIMLTTDPAPSGKAPLCVPPADATGEPQGHGVDIHTLFDTGCEVPESGRLIIHVVWGAHCHHDRLPDAPEGKRFASWEHIICADYVGLQATVAGASKLTFNNIVAPFTPTTRLPVGNKKLTFGR